MLELAGVGMDDIEVVDLYSCFPSAVQLGAAALGLGLDRQLTRTGGLSFAGGPWNNYVMHAIATVMADLRDRPGAKGLVWANGGYVTKHSFGVYGTEPAAGRLPPRVARRTRWTPVRHGPSPCRPTRPGPAVVEAYTVMHDRDGRPETGIAACLLADGRRAWGTTSAADAAAALCEGEWVGRSVTLDADGTLHV